jgi:N-sulfoglucosamine sulfohydrolase
MLKNYSELKFMSHKIPEFTVFTGLNVILGNSIAAVNQPEVGTKPNVMIIIADDATYKDLPLYGGQNLKTPNIDKLAERGLTFNNAFVSMSMSVPCRASLYTGLYPSGSGVCWNHVPARNNTRSIVHHLGDLGYRVGLAGKVHASPLSVFPFEMVEGLERDCVAETAGFETEGIRGFITRNDQQPFCIIAALVVPHVPWTVGDPSHFKPEKLTLPEYLADTKEMRVQFARYLAEMEVLDQQVGSLIELLDMTGKTGNTIVIFTSEQGAQQPGCKWTNWNTGVHTGFIVTWPGRIKAGKQTDAIIQYEDVLPTLVDAIGGQYKTNDFQGSSFLPVLLDRKNSHREYAYFMHNNVPEGPSYPIRSITDGKYHYIRNLNPGNIYIEKHLMARMAPNDYWSSWIFQAQVDDKTYSLVMRYMIRPSEQLYRLDLDPDELVDLAGNREFTDVKKKLSEQLDKWMTDQGDPGAAIDTREFWNDATKGNHFSIVR